MKKGWLEKRLDEIGTTQTGSTPKSSDLASYGDFIPFVKPSDFNNDGSLNYQNDGLSERGLDGARKVAASSVLMVCIGTIGKCGYCDRDVTTNQQINALTPSAGISHKFVYYQMLTDRFQRSVMHGSAQATLPIINKSKWSALTVVFPPELAEQQRIVGVLDEAFASLAIAQANTEKNRQNARALFESHLQSVFTQRGDEVALSELATEVTDGDHSPPPKAMSGVPFITISDIVKRTREIDFRNTFIVPDDYFRRLKPSKKPQIGDVLYTVTGATLGIPVLVKEQRDFCFQRHIGLIRPNPETDSAWLTYALLSPQVFRQATLRSTGTAQKTVSLSVLRSLKISKMGLEQQRRIGRELGEVEAETQRLEGIYQRKLDALAALKKSLLQQAFSGQL